MSDQLSLPIVGADLLSVSQAARILERSPDRVRQYADAKALKCMRFGPKRERYFAPEDVERHLGTRHVPHQLRVLDDDRAVVEKPDLHLAS